VVFAFFSATHIPNMVHLFFSLSIFSQAREKKIDKYGTVEHSGAQYAVLYCAPFKHRIGVYQLLIEKI